MALICYLSFLAFFFGVEAGSHYVNASMISVKLPTENIDIHYFRKTPAHKVGEVLLLHGANFDATVWVTVGSISYLADNGYDVIAVDLPGFGLSPKNKGLIPEPGSLLLGVIEAFGLRKPAILSPSMSGRFSLSLLMTAPLSLSKLIVVAPTIPFDFDVTKVTAQIPTLIVYGSKDKFRKRNLKRLLELEGSQAYEIQDANHACYLDDPGKFNHAVLAFIQGIKILD